MAKKLKVIQQQQVKFYEDKVTAVRVEDGTIYVPVRPLCEDLGISWSSQQNRINRDLILSDLVKNISVFITNAQGQKQHRAMLCLPLDYVSGFLFGINANRVKETVRKKLLRYQRECYTVLSEAFFEGRLTPDTDFDTLLANSENSTVQAYQTFQALTKLAKQQLFLENRIEGHEERIDRLESLIGDPKQHITPDQASQISQAVKAVAHEMGGNAKHYQGVYGEFYRKFGVTSYKQLPQGQYEEAMRFFADWYIALTGRDDVPFKELMNS